MARFLGRLLWHDRLSAPRTLLSVTSALYLLLAPAFHLLYDWPTATLLWYASLFVFLSACLPCSLLLLMDLRSSLPLNKLDQHLKGTVSSYTHFYCIFIGLFLVIINITLNFALGNFLNMSLCLPLFLSDLILFIALSQLVAPLEYVKIRLKKLSTALLFNNFEQDSPSVIQEINKLISDHSHLHQLTLEINTFYSSSVLVVIIFSLISIIGLLFCAMSAFLHIVQNEQNIYELFVHDFIEVFVFGFMAMKDIFKIWCIVHNFELVKRYASTFNRLLFNLVIQDDEHMLIENDFIVSYLEGSIDYKYTACGFILLDHSTFKSLLGTCSTYLFILLQLLIKSI